MTEGQRIKDLKDNTERLIYTKDALAEIIWVSELREK